MARSNCTQCEGTGFVVVGDGRAAAATRCGCEDDVSRESLLERAGIPRRYLHCTLDNFTPRTTVQSTALTIARGFVENFPGNERGLLLTGGCGRGKTHLAAGAFQELVVGQGVEGLFVDYQDLLQRLQATFSRKTDGSEMDVLAPIMRCELLVIDDLGARRHSPWAEDTAAHLLNVRYNEKRPTLLTTNLEEGVSARRGAGADERDDTTLEGALGARVFSRLHEMCTRVHLDGDDYRVSRNRSAMRGGR